MSHPPEALATFNELFIAALRGNASLLQFHDAIAVLHGCETVSNQQYGELAIEAFEELNANRVSLAAGSPLIGQIIDTNNAYLAIAQARSGDLALAQKTAKSPRRRFHATKSNRLLNRLEQELDLIRTHVT